MADLEGELLTWAGRQAPWQKDLLRRVARGDVLGGTELRACATEAERVELAKDAPWSSELELAEALNLTAIDPSHLQATASGTPAVTVHKILHQDGANDLAPGASVEFEAAGLTIAAGRNGSGKSGYTRIIKQVAASRGPEPLLANAWRVPVDVATVGL